MTFDITHQQAIDRGMLRHYLADTINMASTVKAQPNLSHEQRKTLEDAIAAMQWAVAMFGGKAE